MFSTNLDPKDLVDDAFLRRMRHKVEIDGPAREIYEKIFNNYVQEAGHEPLPGGGRLPVRAVLQPRPHARGPAIARDLLETVQSICRFRRIPVQLTRELMIEASASFIREFN